ncbi:hypothetical protein [Ignatzschineria indica]|uniref:hypothetical protein n=1 Tax=Ignatzschineria indica TaxID=472583 RepID=UPI0013002A94|nr:hypothetical protein [Ignatzschineria indica]
MTRQFLGQFVEQFVEQFTQQLTDQYCGSFSIDRDSPSDILNGSYCGIAMPQLH